ncbi:MAG: hybrid sensor histidine kinase/response regulator, partial [Gammaproteobacteria bacterium]
LGLEQQILSAKDRLSIIVIKKGWDLVAVLVDEIMGEREIVIKPLQAPLTNIAMVAGGTLSGSNQVITVINANNLVNVALHHTKLPRTTFQEDSNEVVSRPHILVVDDSITTRSMEKNILESKHYEVTVAVNGKEAWDLLQKQNFSLIITDVNMPIMDGFTLTEQIKNSEKLRELPVIIVTSLGSDAEKKRGMEVGADAYIVKSEFESGILLELVEQLV